MTDRKDDNVHDLNPPSSRSDAQIDAVVEAELAAWWDDGSDGSPEDAQRVDAAAARWTQPSAGRWMPWVLVAAAALIAVGLAAWPGRDDGQAVVHPLSTRLASAVEVELPEGPTRIAERDECGLHRALCWTEGSRVARRNKDAGPAAGSNAPKIETLKLERGALRIDARQSPVYVEVGRFRVAVAGLVVIEHPTVLEATVWVIEGDATVAADGVDTRLEAGASHRLHEPHRGVPSDARTPAAIEGGASTGTGIYEEAGAGMTSDPSEPRHGDDTGAGSREAQVDGTGGASRVRRAKAAADDAADLWSEVRSARRRGSYEELAELYERIIREGPSEGVDVASLALGQLFIGELARPRQAIGPLRRAARSGDAGVRASALAGLVEVYRRLGDSAQELKAIDAYLRAAPRGEHAPTLRERREQLGATHGAPATPPPGP